MALIPITQIRSLAASFLALLLIVGCGGNDVID
jgi:hypothetical protein